MSLVCTIMEKVVLSLHETQITDVTKTCGVTTTGDSFLLS